MLKYIRSTIVYIILAINLLGDTALIASFNTLHLGWKNSNYYKKAEAIAHFDLIALQEVMSKDGLRRLASELERLTGEKWEWHISKQSFGRSNNYREYYAFIYKKDFVKLVRSLGAYDDLEDKFIREPYGAQFKIGDFEFVLVNCHLVFGNKKSDRQLEAMELSKVYDYFKDKSKLKSLFILGDFNLPAYDDAFANLFKHSDLIFYAIDPSNKTTIGHNGLANSYDNIFYSFENTKEYTGRNGVYNFLEEKKYLEKYGDKRFSILRKELSDHLPIYIEVKIK